MMIFAFYKHREKRDIHDEPESAKSIRIHTIKYKFTKHTDNKAKKDWDGSRPFQWLFWNTNNRHPIQKSGIPVFSS